MVPMPVGAAEEGGQSFELIAPAEGDEGGVGRVAAEPVELAQQLQGAYGGWIEAAGGVDGDVIDEPPGVCFG